MGDRSQLTRPDDSSTKETARTRANGSVQEFASPPESLPVELAESCSHRASQRGQVLAWSRQGRGVISQHSGWMCTYQFWLRSLCNFFRASVIWSMTSNTASSSLSCCALYSAAVIELLPPTAKPLSSVSMPRSPHRVWYEEMLAVHETLHGQGRGRTGTGLRRDRRRELSASAGSTLVPAVPRSLLPHRARCAV
eukprot:scaffold307_cov390-Prasinococcus_capsulatus_cf.AAC.27